MSKTTLAFCHNFGYDKATVVEVEVADKKFDESITDPTFFTPVGSMVRKLNAQDKVSLMLPDNLYDFPNGVDDGREIPLSRQKGVDLAELSTEINNQTKSAKKRLTEEAEAQAMAKAMKNAEEEKLKQNQTKANGTNNEA